MKATILTTAYLALLGWIVAILPTACDTEYKVEHPQDVVTEPYISPTDKLVIEWSNDNDSK